jgi:beta-glucanase (GH16 family)
MTDEGLVLSTGVNYDVATHDRYKFKSGLLSTKGRFSQLYGRFDLTCKLPEYEGLYWPAFWLFGAVWPPEIDIFEAMAGEYKSNKQTRHFSTTYHWSDSDGIHKQLGRRLKSRQDLSKEFHTYGVEWTKDKMVWYFDGYPIYQQTGNSPNIPMHVVINTAIAHDATIQQVYQSPAKFVIKNLTVYKTVDK